MRRPVTLPKIKDLTALYCALGITDDHMLLIRGMFGLGSFSDLISKVYPLTKKNAAWIPIRADLLSKLDDDGSAAMRELFDSLNAA